MQPTSIPLLELLRRRRELAPQDVAILLRELPGLLEEGEWSNDRPLLLQLRVEFPGDGTEAAEIARSSLATWPVWKLAFVRDSAGEDATLLGTHTIASARDRRTASSQLALLICELLGGGRRNAEGLLQFSPFPSLSEPANGILKQALEGENEWDCKSLWQEWLNAIGHAATGGEWRVPRWISGRSCACDALDLMPAGGPHVPIRLVARRQFRIGRSRSLSDWAARIEVRGEVDAEASKKVSRVQVLGEWSDDGPTLRDGDGERASANGTTFNDFALPSDRPQVLPHSGILALGGAYRMETVYVEDSGFRGSIAEPASTAENSGAVFFLPLDGRDTIRDAVWIGSEVAFVLTRTGQLRWNDGGEGESAGFFVYRDGQLWIANASLVAGRLKIDEAALAPGEIAPLVPGQLLQTGVLRYHVSRVD